MGHWLVIRAAPHPWVEGVVNQSQSLYACDQGGSPMTAPVLYTLYDLLVDALRQLYAAEQEHLRALPRMATAAQTPELVRVFNDHLGETEEQVSRLERVFAHLEECPVGGTCAGMDGVLLECDSLILTQGHPDVLDAAL